MKTKRSFKLLFALMLALTLIVGAVITASAIEITNDITRVHVNMPTAEAGKRVSNSVDTITWVDNANHYEITDVQWYEGLYFNPEKQLDDGELFAGGGTYTVCLIVKTKGDSTWPTDPAKLAAIDAKLNAGTAKETEAAQIVNGSVIDPNADNYVRIGYQFKDIPYGTVYKPGTSLDAPVAGMTPDTSLSFNSPLIRQNGSISWSKLTDKGWTFMPSGEKFEAGVTYRASFELMTVDGMIFDVPAEPSSEALYVRGWFNGKAIDYVVNRDYYNIAQNHLKASIDFTSVKMQTVSKATVSGLAAPVVGNKPSYDASGFVMGDASYSIDTSLNSDGFTGGICWTDANGSLLSSSDTFEAGKEYILSFALKTGSAFVFDEFATVSSDIGFAEALVDFVDPSICYASVKFAPAGGGAITNVSVDVDAPLHNYKSVAPNPIFGTGYQAGGEICWFDLTDPENPTLMSATDAFKYGKTYRLRIPVAITSGMGFTFAENPSLNVWGADLARLESSSETELVILADFSVGSANYPTVIEVMADGLKVGAPAPEKLYINDALNITDVKWYSDDSSEPMGAGDVFAPNTLYYLYLSVEFKDGYVFAANDAYVNHESVSLYEHTPTDATIIYSFWPEALPTAALEFDLGEGVGVLDFIFVTPGQEIELPSFSGCTAPAGYVFAGWSSSNDVTYTTINGKYKVPAFTSATAAITLYARYVPLDNSDPASHVHVFGDSRIDLGNGECGYRCIFGADCPDTDGGRSFAPDQDMRHQYGNYSRCDEVCDGCGHIRTEYQQYSDGGTPDDPSDDVPYIPLHFYETECQRFCSACGKERDTAAPHTPGAEPTCTEDQRCVDCNAIILPMHGHDFGDPTCESAAACKNDGCTATAGVALGHTPGEAATCTAGQKCTVCNKELSPALAHTPGAAATCTAPQKCTVCEAVLDEIKAHTPGSAATCTSAQKCTVCDAELVPASGHTAGVEWISDEAEHYKLCACGEKVEKGAHADADENDVCDACGYDMSTGLSVGAIIGIIIGAVVLLGGGGFAVWFFVIKKKKS